MTNQEIKTVGQTIAQETQIGGNTAARVGGVIEGIGVALDNKDAAINKLGKGVSELNDISQRTQVYLKWSGNGSWIGAYLKEFLNTDTLELFVSTDDIVTDNNTFFSVYGYETEEAAQTGSGSGNRYLYAGIQRSELDEHGVVKKRIIITKESQYKFIRIAFRAASGTLILESPMQSELSKYEISNLSKEIDNISDVLMPTISGDIVCDNAWHYVYLGNLNVNPKVYLALNLNTLVLNTNHTSPFIIWAWTNESDAKIGSAKNRTELLRIPNASVITGNEAFTLLIEAPNDYPYIGFYTKAISGKVNYSLLYSDTITGKVGVCEELNNSPLLYGAIYDGVHDCSYAIQKALDKGGMIKFEGDGSALIKSTLVIKNSNTSIIADPTFTFKLANGVNAPMIRTKSAAYHSDSEHVDTERITNISVSGGIWDGNHANQTKQKLFQYQALFMFADIDNLDFNDLEIKNPIAYGTLFGGINRFNIYNIHLNYEEVLINMDGVHLHGNCKDGVIENIWGNTHDDMVALNFDGDSSVPAELDKRMLRRGDCINIYVHNIFGYDTHRCIRLFGSDTYKVDNIVIDGIYGNYFRNGVISIAAWYSIPSYLGRVIIRNVLAYTKEGRTTLINPQNEIINIGEGGFPCVIDSLTLENIQVKNNTDFQHSLLRLERSDSNIKSLRMNNCQIRTDNVDNSNYNFIGGIGSIDNCIINNCETQAPSTEAKLNAISTISPSNLLVSNSIFNAINKYSASGIISESNVIYNNTLQI